jgi:type I restriction enzyme R subunit
MAKKEAQARIKINCLLEESGWRLTDSDNGKANVSLETKTPLGDDFEHVKNGFIDYLLLDNNQKPVCVLETKRETIPPLSAKEQARRYANSIHARYVLLSNGNTHYLWDLQFGNHEPVSVFLTLEMLASNEDFKPDTNEQVRKAIASREFGRLAGIGSVSMSDLRLLNGIFQSIIQYINDYVPLDKLNLREAA